MCDTTLYKYFIMVLPAINKFSMRIGYISDDIIILFY